MYVSSLCDLYCVSFCSCIIIKMFLLVFSVSCSCLGISSPKECACVDVSDDESSMCTQVMGPLRIVIRSHECACVDVLVDETSMCTQVMGPLSSHEFCLNVSQVVCSSKLYVSQASSRVCVEFFLYVSQVPSRVLNMSQVVCSTLALYIKL